MSIQEKISNAYQMYLLCDKNIAHTLTYTKITRPTLLKYIKLQECLDFEILEYLDRKGSQKLTITDALKFCDNVMNPEQQYEIFQDFIKTKKSERISFLKEQTICLICADSSNHFEYTPCCNTPICNKCFMKTLSTTIQDLIFKPLCCLFCKKGFSLIYLKWFLKENKISGETWRNNSSYDDYRKYVRYKENLYMKYMTILSRIEDKKDYYITDTEPDYNSLLGEDTFYAACSQCSPKPRKRDLHRINTWNRLLLCDMPKACGNGEGGLLVLQPEMFRCVVCKSRDENLEDGEFKKCPHCGIKTVKPDGCNFIYCGDHRWCWICNERIENNEDGHNKHYWTGPGTSPYTNRCRESVDYKDRNGIKQPTFVMKGNCDCSSCAPHDGAPVCSNIDCMNRTTLSGENNYHKYCVSCMEKELLEERWV